MYLLHLAFSTLVLWPQHNVALSSNAPAHVIKIRTGKLQDFKAANTSEQEQTPDTNVVIPRKTGKKNIKVKVLLLVVAISFISLICFFLVKATKERRDLEKVAIKTRKDLNILTLEEVTKVQKAAMGNFTKKIEEALTYTDPLGLKIADAFLTYSDKKYEALKELNSSQSQRVVAYQQVRTSLTSAIKDYRETYEKAACVADDNARVGILEVAEERIAQKKKEGLTQIAELVKKHQEAQDTFKQAILGARTTCLQTIADICKARDAATDDTRILLLIESTSTVELIRALRKTDAYYISYYKKISSILPLSVQEVAKRQLAEERPKVEQQVEESLREILQETNKVRREASHRCCKYNKTISALEKLRAPTFAALYSVSDKPLFESIEGLYEEKKLQVRISLMSEEEVKQYPDAEIVRYQNKKFSDRLLKIQVEVYRLDYFLNASQEAFKEFRKEHTSISHNLVADLLAEPNPISLMGDLEKTLQVHLSASERHLAKLQKADFIEALKQGVHATLAKDPT